MGAGSKMPLCVVVIFERRLSLKTLGQVTLGRCFQAFLFSHCGEEADLFIRRG